MKCIVCGMSMGDLPECPRCGFEVLEVIGERTPELERIHEGYANRYRNLYLGDMKLGVTVYEWKLDSEHETVEQVGKSVAWFAPWKELPTGRLSWLPQAYRTAKTVDQVELTIHIKKPGRREALRGLRFATTGCGDEWQLGVRKESNGDLTFALGTPDRYNSAEAWNLFEALHTLEAE